MKTLVVAGFAVSLAWIAAGALHEVANVGGRLPMVPQPRDGADRDGARQSLAV